MSSCCTCSILNPRPPAHGFLFSLKSHCRAVAEVRAGVRDLCESAAPGTDGAIISAAALQQRDFGEPLDDVIVDFRRQVAQTARLRAASDQVALLTPIVFASDSEAIGPRRARRSRLLWRKGSSQFHADQAHPRPALGEAEMVRSEFSGSSPSTNAVNSIWAFVKSSALSIGSSRSRISPSKRVAAHSPSNWASSVLNSTFLSSVSSASPLLSAASVLPTVGFGVRNTSAADFFRRGLKWI
jgi:hypothetical protein